MRPDDTYPLSETRIRIPFRDMTTAEAEYHALVMWPYFEAKVSAVVEEKIRNELNEHTRQVVIQTLGDILALSNDDAARLKEIESIFWILKLIHKMNTATKRICIRCIMPWTLAALTGLLGLLLNHYFPYLANIIDYAGLVDRH
jgi:hypothetical protein